VRRAQSERRWGSTGAPLASKDGRRTKLKRDQAGERYATYFGYDDASRLISEEWLDEDQEAVYSFAWEWHGRSRGVQELRRSGECRRREATTWQERRPPRTSAGPARCSCSPALLISCRPAAEKVGTGGASFTSYTHAGSSIYSPLLAQRVDDASARLSAGRRAPRRE